MTTTMRFVTTLLFVTTLGGELAQARAQEGSTAPDRRPAQTKAAADGKAAVVKDAKAPTGQAAKAPVSGAPNGAAAAAPTPPAEIDELYKPFAGVLKCDTKFAAGAMGPGSPEVMAKTTVRIKKDLGGFWYRGEYETAKTKALPGVKGVFYMGYDAAAKQALITGVDNAGAASWGTGQKQGDAIVFEEQSFMMGTKAKIRETMSSADKQLLHKVEIDVGKGFGYQPMIDETCTK
jgi:hypothetical protein